MTFLLNLIHISTVSKVPFHFENLLDNLIKELTEEGVNELAKGLTDWCSPTRFVLKPGTEGSYGSKFHMVKLVCKDLCILFHSQVIFWGVCDQDLVHGYFQYELAEESHDLTVNTGAF